MPPPASMDEGRRIIHIDMDAFFAAVEQRDDPALRGKPVIVGGPPDSRGVVSTCSYEARAFGVRSAMPSSQAYRLCPHAVFVRPRIHAYTLVSRQIRGIFFRYSDCVEPLSLDEAFLDLSVEHLSPLAKRIAAKAAGDQNELAPAIRVAEGIRKDIRLETGLSGSAGVSYCKFLAKVASDMQKPDGLSVIRFCDARAFLDALPVEGFFGVGKATAVRLHALGIKTGRDLANSDQTLLLREFGKQGALLFDLARGRDSRAVESFRERKSYGRETTFQHDSGDMEYINSVLADFVSELVAALIKEGLRAATVTVKVRYGDFSTETRSATLPQASDARRIFQEKAAALLDRTEAEKRSIRLIGVSLSGLVRGDEVLQEELPFE